MPSIVKLLRRFGPATLVLAGALTPALAQAPFSPANPGAAQRNPACVRLEGQLAAFDRGGADPRADQAKRAEDAVGKQQVDLDRVVAQSRKVGCEGRGFFALFSNQPAQCTQINAQIDQMRANLDRALADLQRAQGGNADRDGQRRTILAALGQSDCGPQYRQYANQGGGGFFDGLFGPGASILSPGGPAVPSSGDTYRTLCVRTCDGFYFPISYSTTPARFADDERVCQRLCPASDAVLYSHRNPGEDVPQAVSISGQPYTSLPTAFAFRKAFNPSCSCKAANQTWADALKALDDQTVERGDIVVNEERAKQLSLPQFDAQGKPIRAPVRPAAQKGNAAPAPAPVAAAAKKPDDDADPAAPKKPVRTVGPTFAPSSDRTR
jgi:hypothetical protein